MSVDLIKFAFIAGELSPKFFGRSDLEKFDLGVAKGQNWFVDYSGGISTRPGFEFYEFIKSDSQDIKLFPFNFSSDLANTYVLLFGHNYVRFVQDGSYVLESAKAVANISQASPAVLESTSHGYSNGDWVKLSGIGGMTALNGRTAVVTGVTTHTFQLYDTFGQPISTVGMPMSVGGSVQRVYTLATPYPASALAKLHIYQRKDLVRITHVDYYPHDLIRTDHTSWSLDFAEIGSSNDPPDGIAVEMTSGDTDAEAISVSVTSVDEDGQESVGSLPFIFDTAVDISTANDSFKITWNPEPGADYYKVYRSNLILDAGASMTRGAQLGYIGRAYGTVFYDNFIQPDFTAAPPVGYNPFARRAIKKINVTNGGSGYDNDSIINITDPDGNGFLGYPVVVDGVITAVVIERGGQNYTAPTAAATVGTGATFTIETAPATGIYPSLNAVLHQRWIYAASKNDPLTVWGSRPQQFGNFDVRDVVTANDSFEFELDSDNVTPIRHMKAVKGGLLLFTEAGVWLLNGGANGQPITPTNVLADPHTYIGSADVQPLAIDTDLLYVESKGSTVRLLDYLEATRLYSGKDVSILSSHLLADNPIVEWTFASDPHKIAWAVQEDGSLLAFALVKDQEIFAWTQCKTRGRFKRVLAVRENNTDQVYVVVERYVRGAWRKYLEGQRERKFASVEEAWCVDSGLRSPLPSPDATITPSGTSGSVTLNANASVFAAEDVGKVWRGGGGKGTVTAVNGPTSIVVDLVRPITQVIPEDPDNRPTTIASGAWSITALFTGVGGLWHLEGEKVNALVDGNVVKNLVVTNGQVALPEGSLVTLGLGFRCVLQTLPLTIPGEAIEGRRKRVPSLMMRLHESRGLQSGRALDKLYDVRERTNEAWGEPTRLISGVKGVLIEPKWDDDGQTYLIQDNPLPATVLGLVTVAEVGDDPN